MNDEQLISTWQQVRKALGAVDERLSCALTSADAPGALVHEALAAVAASASNMLPISHLAEVLGLSTGGCTKLVERLISAGFVRRHHSATDRRVVYAALTDDGAAHERQSTVEYAEQLRIELSVLGPGRLAQLWEIASVLRGWAPEPSPSENSIAPRPPRPVDHAVMGLPGVSTPRPTTQAVRSVSRAHRG